MAWSRAAFALLLLAAGCGKVGPIRPPLVRIPENIADLTARQDAYTIVLTWTNPALYIDQNPVEALTATIVRNNMDVAVAPVIGPGKPQTYVVDVRDALGMDQYFAIRFQAEGGRVPGFSNMVTYRPVDVPGPVLNLDAVADQYRIRVSWQPPDRNSALAESYIVQRMDEPAPHVVTDAFYDDPEVKPGASYTYTVRAARGSEPVIPGPPAPSISIVANDKTEPEVPSGVILEPDAVVAGRVFVTWEDNSEADLAGYRVHRSDRPDGNWVVRTPKPVQKGFFDSDYVSGMYYAVSAVDFFGNESERSSPQQGP